MGRSIALLLITVLVACAPPPPAPTATAPPPSPAAGPAIPLAVPTPIPLAPATAESPIAPATAPPSEAGVSEPGTAPLRVFADPAFGPALAELATAFGNLFPGERAELTLLPSAELVTRLGGGEAADLVALAGLAPVRAAVDAGVIEEDLAIPVATDRLVLVAPLGGSAELDALAAPGVRLALLDETAEAGAAARRALERLEVSAAGAVSYPDEQAVLAALAAGEADLALLYGSAITPLVELDVRFSELPRDAQEPRTLTIAPVRATSRPELAEEFLTLVASGAGQATLSAYNLQPAASDTAGPQPIYSALELGGAVDQPLSLSAEELATRPQITVEAVDRRGETQTFTGTRLRDLLVEARPQPGASVALLLASDDYSQEVPLDFLLDCAECVLVLEKDGSLRAVLPGYDQAAWVRLLVLIELR